jgi:porin
MTAWHADERDNAGVEESWGVTASANWTSDDQAWMPFARAGWSDGSAPLMNGTATLGLLHYISDRSDVLGLAGNWGKPSDDTLRDQYTGELFHRIQLAQNLAITPSVQLVVDPALNPDQNEVWIGSVRARVTF